MSASVRRLPAALADSRVLVVDDEQLYRQMMVRFLRRAGVRHIETAANGSEGLAKTAGFGPDLIILDVNMPEMTGYEMCRLLRADPATADIPVLFQTGAATETEQSECFAAGGSDYIAKPVRLGECLARVEVHLRIRQMMLALQSYASRVETELAAARAMQSELTPSAAHIGRIAAGAGLAIDVHVETSSELGGDTALILDLGQGRVGLMLADFSGHGIAAAINTFRLHTLLVQNPPRPDAPGDWLGEMNDLLCDTLTEGQFATFFFGVLEPGSDLFRYAACGGPDPVVAVGTDCRLLDASGLPLGISKGTRYDTREAILPPGSALLLYSDALSESEGPDAPPLGYAGVLALCQRFMAGDGTPIPDFLQKTLLSRRPLNDDLTLVWVARTRAV